VYEVDSSHGALPAAWCVAASARLAASLSAPHPAGGGGVGGLAACNKAERANPTQGTVQRGVQATCEDPADVPAGPFARSRAADKGPAWPQSK
jgi:hypothetical protein